jgi:hypothetical protein
MSKTAMLLDSRTIPAEIARIQLQICNSF